MSKCGWLDGSTLFFEATLLKTKPGAYLQSIWAAKDRESEETSVGVKK